MAAAAKTAEAEKAPTNKITKEDTYANGVRAAREAKGYSRIGMAAALDISVGEYWKAETAYEGKDLAAILKAIRAVEPAEKPVRATKPKAEKAPAAKGGKAPAKKAAPKAKPADATDLI